MPVHTFYEKLLPSRMKLDDNRDYVEKYPPNRVEVQEKDSLVILDVKPPGEEKSFQVLMGADDARDLIAALKEAIKEAEDMPEGLTPFPRLGRDA